MSINDAIINALTGFTSDVVPDLYTGEETEYITFNYSSRGANFADNAPNHEINSVQVHYFCPASTNSLSKRKQIKKALFAAGFTWPEVIDASDKEGQHWVFECEYLEAI